VKIGDLVKIKGFNGDPIGPWIVPGPLGLFAGDIGIIIEIPKGMGNVVDLLIREKKIRYWIEGLEVV